MFIGQGFFFKYSDLIMNTFEGSVAALSWIKERLYRDADK